MFREITALGEELTELSDTLLGARTLATVVYGKDVEKNSAGEYAATQIIRSYAFSGCAKLEYLTLTAVSKIDGGAFAYCNKLKSVTVEKTAEVAADAFPSTVKAERRV